MAHLLKLNEGRSSDELELKHDSYQGMGETLYMQVCLDRTGYYHHITDYRFPQCDPAVTMDENFETLKV